MRCPHESTLFPYTPLFRSFPVEERRVLQSDVPGEVASPTQPFPAAPPPLAPQQISAEDAWGPTSEDRETCRTWIRALRNEGDRKSTRLNSSHTVISYAVFC